MSSSQSDLEASLHATQDQLRETISKTPAQDQTWVSVCSMIALMLLFTFIAQRCPLGSAVHIIAATYRQSPVITFRPRLYRHHTECVRCGGYVCSSSFSVGLYHISDKNGNRRRFHGLSHSAHYAE